MSSQGNHHDGQGMVVTIQIKCMTLNHLCHVGKKTTWLIHNKKIVKDKKKKKSQILIFQLKLPVT